MICHESDFSRTGVSIDYHSDSSTADDNAEQIGSDIYDWVSASADYEESSVGGDITGAFSARHPIHLHNPLLYDCRHCPPL